MLTEAANRGFADEVQFRQLIALAKSYVPNGDHLKYLNRFKTSAENKLALAAVKAIAALCRSCIPLRLVFLIPFVYRQPVVET